MSENQNLLAEQRRALILDEVRRRGGVRVNELTRKLGVSDMTVRRDLDALARQGVLEKVHGGAVPVVEASTHEPGFEAKSGLELTAKEDIARAAAELVAPGTAIALSGGTTTYALAHHLLEVPDLTVVTNSVRVADVFHAAQRTSGQRQGAATVVLTGGVRTLRLAGGTGGRPGDRGAPLRHAVPRCARHIDRGRPVDTEPRGGRDQPMRLVQSARRVVVVADHTKWGTVGLSSFAALEQVDTLVTDAGLPVEARADISEHLRLMVAGEAGDGADI